MLNELFAGIEQWPLAVALRGSTWAYPLVNTAHIVGIALLFGGIAPLDLRLAGFWRRIPIAPLRRVLVPMAITGLIVAVSAGALLFIGKAGDYAASPLFQAKMALLILALVNAGALRLARDWRSIDNVEIPGRWPRLAGIASVMLWFTVILLGRLIGYS